MWPQFWDYLWQNLASIQTNARFDTTQPLYTAHCTQGNVPIKLWRNTDEGSPPGVRTSRITDLVDVVLRQVLEHHAHVEVILHRGSVKPHVQLAAQGLGLGPGIRLCVNWRDFLFLNADQTVANVSLMQKCLNEIACYFAFLKLDFLSRSKSLISR